MEKEYLCLHPTCHHYLLQRRCAYIPPPESQLLTRCVVTGTLGITKLSQISGNLQATSIFEILDWMISTWSLFMATQLISTTLIAGKIWWHAKRNPTSRSRYLSLIALVVESGAVFTLTSAALLVCAVLKIQAGDIALAIAIQSAVSKDRTSCMRILLPICFF